LDEELEFHIQMRAEELVSTGMRADEARREAEREFGDRDRTRRYCEQMDRGSDRADRLRDWFGGIWHDVRIAARGARQRPGYALVVIATLALGVGANTAVFSVLDSVLLRRLPFPSADRLVTVDEDNRRVGLTRSDIAAAEYLDWAARQRSFSGIAVHAQSVLTYADASAPVMLNGKRVSANFFDVLGIRATIGRTFESGEDRGAHRVVVLTNGAWTRLLGASKDIVGKPIVLGGDSYTVIGVLPADFFVPGMTPRDYFVPLDLDAAIADVNRARKFHYLHGFGRLRDGVSLEAARAELTSIARGIERENPGVGDGHLTTVLPIMDATVGDVRPTVLALMGAAGFVLLIAVANLASLALGRALLRRREFAVRTALGASRSRLVRVALSESVSLALIGGTIGAAIAWWGTPALLSLYPSAIPPSFAVKVNGTALVFAVVIATLTGMAVGMVPVFAIRRGELSASLGDGSRGSSAGRPHTRARDALVVAQIALAIVLVVGAGLLVQTLARLQALDLGFAPTNVSFVWLNLTGPRYRDGTSISDFWRTVLTRLRHEPALELVALSATLPLAGGSGASLAIEGRENRAPLPEIRYGDYSDGVLRTLGVALVAGRDFDDRDAAPGTRTVLINQALARKFWPGQNPIGARVRLGPDPSEPWSEVVGVIGDYRQESLDSPVPPLAVTMYQQDVWRGMLITVKSTASPKVVQATIAAAVHDLDPAQAVGAPTTLESMIDGALAQRRFAMSVLATFSALALALALVGVYGVIVYNVTARRREFGVRVALGALPRQLVGSVLGYGVRLATVGLVLGVGAALFLTRFLSTLLYEVRPLDAATFAGSASVLCAATVAACWGPARRAGRVDPVVAMRVE
jgi:putative ABC transport system permease protein